MSGSVTYYDGTTIRANTPGSTGQVLVSQGSSAPIFQNAGATSLSFAAVYTSDQSNVTGDGTHFVLIPDTTLVSNGFSYNNSTGEITVNNTGIFSVLCRLLLTGINGTHNSAEWILYSAGPTNLAIDTGANLFSGADINTQFPANFNTVLSLIASTTFNISFQANGGSKTIGTTLSNFNTCFIQILQIG